LLLFLEKEGYHMTGFLGGKPPNPLGPLRGVLGSKPSSEKQNNAFCFFFWKKKDTT
jgi:hypothetical protein